MSAKTIRNALGLLQDDPDHERAWRELEEEVTAGSEDMTAEELGVLLEHARRAHEMRREYDAVARILKCEVAVAEGTAREAELQEELARVLDEELLDDADGTLAYKRLLDLRPGYGPAEEAIQRSEAKRGKWLELVKRYVSEAKATGEGSFKSSLKVSAAEIAYRFGRPQILASKEKGARKRYESLIEQIVTELKEAIETDPRNRRASILLERVQRQDERWEDLAKTLEGLATESNVKEEKIAGWVRLARVLRKKIGSPERAMAAYERVIDLQPTNGEASSALVEFFNEREMWDHLVALYEGQLQAGGVRAGQEVGTLLQIAMVHWRMRGRPEQAEPYFERLRKIEPAHPGMLGFFREWATSKGSHGRLATILADAQRVMPDGPERHQVVAEIARLAEEGANAQKAIEQWRSLLRQDPSNKQAREALKRLYRHTAGWNALADLLRGELERIPQTDAAARLPVLREIAKVYRDELKSDSALVTVLSQITQLDPNDVEAVRELARVYEVLQRWRELLATQARQAELETEPSIKAELHRAVARRWLDQFTNVQNAVEAYEKLHELSPGDAEASEKLKELYAKRRAYRPLYNLYALEAAELPVGSERRAVWMEMAKLAAERLDKGADAAKLYKQVLDEDPTSAAALDALERQADRDKDFTTVADVLEKRFEVATDEATKLSVLQKLGAIYADRLHDHAGATRAWRRVLALQPGHAKALRVLRDSHLAMNDFDGLTELYAQSEDWEGLVEVLSGAADKAADPELKIDLSYRAADIYASKLKAPPRAFRAYERVLAVRPDDQRAAASLVPIYENDEKWGRLPQLYEVLLGHTTDEDMQLALLEKLVSVTGHHLQDRATALGYARRAYELAPERDGALAAFERATRAAGQWGGFLEALNGRLKNKKAKKDEKRVLRAKLAEIYGTELGKLEEAVAAYKTLVEEDEKDELAVQTLDRMLRRADQRDDLRWLFDVRVERANTAQKLELLGEWAILEEESFGEPERAAKLYRRILEIVPEHGRALRALARMLKAAGDGAGAAEILEKDRDTREGPERAAREVELARVYLEMLNRPAQALSAAKRALELVPNDGPAIEVVEDLLKVGETRGKAASILEKIYAGAGNARRQAEVLEVLIGTTAAHDDRLELYGRLIDVHAKQLNDSATAFDVVARAVNEFPAELSLWDRLGILANVTGRSQKFVDAITQAVPPHERSGLPEAVELDLAERAATLYDEKLGEVDRARPYLEKILDQDPSNERAFTRLKQILTTQEKWLDLEGMYERAVQTSTDPLRRSELLAEVALVCEEITGEPVKAIGFYERILEIDPSHEQAMRSLDTLYAGEQRWEALARLLKRRLSGAGPDEALGLKLRLGILHYMRLEEPGAALDYLEEVLREQPSNAEAQKLVERILEVPELRARAAVVLESVYAERDEVPELVRAIEIHLEFAKDPAERRDLLRRVAELRDERLRDDASAFDGFARLVPLDPEDVRARTRMMEIARRIGAHARAAEVLVACAEAARSPLPRAEILMNVARIYEDYLHDAARAEAVLRQVLEIAPDDADIALPASRSLERVYEGSGKHAELARILKIEVKLEDNVEARRTLYARLGELCENVLGDPHGAVEAWRARLEDDANDANALVALDRLYERTQDWRALVETLRARERLAEDGQARKQLVMRIATTLAEKLGDVNEGILAYRALIDDFGASRPALDALATLYEVADRWDDVAETLEAHLELAEDPGDKLELLARLGNVREQKLADLPGALEVYRQALVLDPGHAPSRTALEGLLDDAAARRDAAAILRPLYEADGLAEKLLRVLEIEADHADSVGGKLEVFAQAVTVAESGLGDPERAFGYAARGLREAASEPDFPRWLERAERLAERTRRHEELVSLLRSVIPDILDGDVQLEVTLKVAQLARTQLGNVALAKANYVKALELRADDRRVLEALQSLYEETQDAPALLDILKRRVEASESDAERKALLYKEARLSDATLGDARGAIGVYEQILEIAVEKEALDALERLYTQCERWEDLIALYERELSMPTKSEQKANLHHALGTVLDKRIHEPERAFDEFEAALKIDPQHAATVASLEGMMHEGAHASRAAEMLESVYLARLDWRRVMVTLEARLAASQDPDDRRQLLRRLAKLREEQEEDYRAALETTAKLLAEDVTDETTWGELERLARVANAEARLAEIYATELEKLTGDELATARLAKRTGELFEVQGNAERALVFYRRAYAFDPQESKEAFAALDRLLRAGDKPRERVALYKDLLDYRSDPQERVRILHTIAGLEEKDLGDDVAASVTYRAALDIDESDPSALEALAKLYARTDRYKELVELTRRRAEQSALPEDEARHRLELGKLLEHRMEDLTAAIDEYQAVVELSHDSPNVRPAEAIKALEGLMGHGAHKARVVDLLRPIYEGAQDWQSLVKLNVERLSLAADAGEKVSILRETARLWEERGRNAQRAFDATRDAFVLDPEDGAVREELDRFAAATKRWDDLAAAYEKGIEKIEGPGQAELLFALAKLHDKLRDDPRRALDAYERLFRLDETDIAPLEEMDALATLLSDWPVLVRVLTKKAELLPDDESRASTWRRIGESRRDMLDDVPGAIDAYERALELEPDSAWTLDNLIALYEIKNDAARLVDLYRRRVELCGPDDESLRYQLLLDAATRYEAGLGDRREAIQVLTEALAVKPADAEVVGRLDNLYTAERMWPELLDNLRLQAAVAGDPAVRLGLKARIARLLAGELDDARQALEAYREVLDAGFDEAAVRAIRDLGESRDELRLDASTALEPVLRAAGKYTELVEVLEMRLRAQSEPAERARTLRAIAEAAESWLGNSSLAEGALLRALAEEPSNAGLHTEIERLADSLGSQGWQRYADALAERAGALFDVELTTDLYVRLGRVADTKLRDERRAASAYVAAAERGGDTASVLTALDRLYGNQGEMRALADILERRVAIEADAGAQADLYHRLAVLQIKSLGEPGQGLTLLRQALERVQDHAKSREALEALLEDGSMFDDAFEALEWVYRGLGKSHDLARLYEKKVGRAQGPGERTRARLDLARVLETDVHDGAQAQRVVEAAVLEDPSDQDVLAELYRLATANQAWQEASTALARALGSTSDLAPGTASELWVRLAGWRRDKLNDAAGAEEALTEALKLDAENLSILRALEDLRRGPGRERDLVETLRTRAKLEADLDAKRTALREAKALAEGTLGDAALAEATLRDLLREDEADAWALEELTRLREAAGDHAEVVTLLLRRAELAPDGGDALALKKRAAEVLTASIGDVARAIGLYEDVLDSEPTDATSASKLRTLYGQAKRDRDLGKLLERLIDVATSARERSLLRLELAKLEEEKFSSAEDAIDTLRALIDEEPGNQDAILALSELLEKTGKDAELADLLKSQLEAAQERGDTGAELLLLVRLGEVYETRLEDSASAQRTYEAVLERDPSHRAALEAAARLSERRDAWPAAAAALARLVELASDAAGLPFALRLAAAREKIGDGDGVEEALKLALELDPINKEVRSKLQGLYEKGKKWVELADLLVGDADLVKAANPNAAAPPAPPPNPSTRSLHGSSPSVPPPAVSEPVAAQVKLLRRAAEIHSDKRKSPADAIPILERAAALVPHDRELLLVLCDAYNAAKRERDAAKVLEQVIASFGNKRSKELSLYHHRLGRALAQLGDRDVALTHYDMAFKIDPGSVLVLKDLGVLAFETNDLERAQKTFRALLLQRLDGSTGISKGEVFYYLGEISARQGDKEKARTMFERAIENEPTLERAKTKLLELKG